MSINLCQYLSPKNTNLNFKMLVAKPPTCQKIPKPIKMATNRAGKVAMTKEKKTVVKNTRIDFEYHILYFLNSIFTNFHIKSNSHSLIKTWNHKWMIPNLSATGCNK